jgi:hypothetical protein
MLPPHCPITCEVQTNSWGRIKLKAIVADFGYNAEEFRWDCRDNIFADFCTYTGMYPKPINARRKKLNKDVSQRLRGAVLFLQHLAPDRRWAAAADVLKPECLQYEIFEMPHIAFKQMRAAFNRVKKVYGYREIVVPPCSLRMLRTFVTMHRKVKV